MSYDGVYEAKAVVVNPDAVLVLVPQIFRDQQVPVNKWTGSRPAAGERGFVSFIGGDPAWPVWFSSSSGGSGTPGPQGPPGERGPAGADGQVGPTGSTGAQGEVGPTGPAGDDGSDGDDGADGLPGYVFEKMVVIGDSLSAWGSATGASPGSPPYPFPYPPSDRWSDLLVSQGIVLELVDGSYPGYTTRDAVASPKVPSQECDLFVVFLGANDQVQMDRQFFGIPATLPDPSTWVLPTEYGNNLRTLLDRYPARQQVIVFPWKWNKQLNDSAFDTEIGNAARRNSYLSVATAVAEERSIPLVDLGLTYNGAVGSGIPVGSPTIPLHSYLIDPLIHSSALGHIGIANLIKEALKSQGAQGPAGPAGPQGEPGEQGPQGEPGEQGPPGDPDVSTATKEPIGHADKTQSAMSFDNSSRTFTISPVGDTYEVWCAGTKYDLTSQSITIPNTTGLYYVSFTAGVLSYSTSFFIWDSQAPTAYIYWNQSTGKAEFFADERHGVAMDWATHEYLHRTRGASLANGFDLNSYTIGGIGTSNSDAQVGLNGGTFFDEDNQIDVVSDSTPGANTFEQDLASPAKIPVFYRLNGAWQADSATSYPLKQGTSRPRYNLNSSGTWSTVDASNNKYIVSWLVATNNLGNPVLSILGQGQYDNVGIAEAVSWEDLDLNGLPIVEIRPLYKLIFHAANSYSNTPHASLVSVQDIRSFSAVGAGNFISDHGQLSGLSDDDHAQYALADGSRGSFAAASHASTHASGGSDAVSLAASQITSGTISSSLLGTKAVGGQAAGSGVATTTTPASILTSAITLPACAAGDLLLVEGSFTIFNNSTGGRTYTLGIKLGATTVTTVAIPSQSNATTRTHMFQAYIRVQSTTSENVAAVMQTSTVSAIGTGVATENIGTGSLALDILISSSNSAATQTTTVEHVSVVKVAA